VQKINGVCPPRLARWIHIPLTSYDPLDTGRILAFVRAHNHVVQLKIAEVIGLFRDLILKYSDTVQIGRTHGQHALPITVGFWLACILSRLIFNARKMDEFSGGLVGKISGAVGAYNAQFCLGLIPEGESFEERVLAKVGLKPAPISSQILPPEPLAYYLFSCLMTAATLAQLGRDCRHLMRSEIAEVGEPFDKGQVGSSTMAHKRNPINFENLEGMYIRTKNEFGKVLDTLISEHQRDLVGSCVMRDFPIIIVNLTQQLDTLLRRKEDDPTPFLARLTVNSDALRKNLLQSAKVILAEPIYIALQMAGYEGDAHKLVNEQAMAICHQRDVFLIDAIGVIAEYDVKVSQALAAIPKELAVLFYSPEKYTGLAASKAVDIAFMADDYLR